MDRAALVRLLRPYRRQGCVKGGELLVPPDVALRLADDLEWLGVPIMGLDGWYLIEYDGAQRFVQDLGIDFSVPEDILHGDDPVRGSVASVQNFIQHELPATTPAISFTLDVPPDWELFPDEPA